LQVNIFEEIKQRSLNWQSMWYSILVKWCYFWTTALSRVVQKH